MRVNRNSSDNNSTINLYEQIKFLESLFSDIMLVNPIYKNIINVNEYKLEKTNNSCADKCPLGNDKCGCICKDTLSSEEDRCRFVYNSTSAYFVISKLFRTKYTESVLVMIMRLGTNFSFGDISEDKAIDTIAKLSSNLVIDPLTKLYNRKYLSDNINYIIEKCKNSNHPLCLACIDIDNFKRFNDTYGHEFGDKVLISVANNMVNTTKLINEAYNVRIGGDEFLIVGVNITKQKFKMIMTNLCEAVDNTKLQYQNEKVGIRISIGVSELLSDNLNNYKELYNKADEQLYMAKEAGKGCVR